MRFRSTNGSIDWNIPHNAIPGDITESRNFITTYNSFCFLFRTIHNLLFPLFCCCQRMNATHKAAYSCFRNFVSILLRHSIFFRCTLQRLIQSGGQSISHSVKLHISYFKCLINLTERNALFRSEKPVYRFVIWFLTNRLQPSG